MESHYRLGMAVRGLTFVTLLLSTLMGCGLVGTVERTMTGEEVAKEVEAQLREQPNVSDGTLECPDLRDGVGEEVRCTRTVQADGVRATIGVTVTVQEPDQDGNNLSFQVDDEPETVTVLASALEDQLRTAASSGYGEEPETMECPELPGKVGESVICDFTVAGEPHRARVTVTGVEGTEVSFKLKELG